MKKTNKNSRLEVWGVGYVNGVSRSDDDKDVDILQIEPTNDSGSYMVEIVDSKAEEEKETEERDRLLQVNAYYKAFLDFEKITQAMMNDPNLDLSGTQTMHDILNEANKRFKESYKKYENPELA